MDKKSVYWSSSYTRILNVQDIIKERTKETSSNIYSTCIPFHHHLRCWPTFIQYLPTMYLVQRSGCRPTTKFRFNVEPALQPIAGSMPVNRLRCWPNTNLSQDLLYTLRKHVAFNQCCYNVDPQSSMLARN